MSTSEVNTSVEERKNKMSESGGPVPPRQAPRPGTVLRAPGKDTHLGKWSIGLRSSNGARDSLQVHLQERVLSKEPRVGGFQCG